MRADVSVVGRQAVSGAIAQLSAEGRSAEATEATAVAAGRLLGAQWVISGGYQRLGDRMRITARVVEVATATVLHTAIVDGTVTDLFALQDRLATNLRQRLTRDGSTATPAVTARASAPAPVDAAPRATPEDAEPAIERPPAAAAAPVSAAGTADPTRIIDSPAPPLAPATIARDALRRATLRAVRLTDALDMDGVLDEDVYATVPSFGDFIQQIPLAGEPSTERTEAWVFYDAAHVYVAGRLWDSASEAQWVVNEMRRDSMTLFPVYPGFPTIFSGLLGFFVGDFMGKALWQLVENAQRFPRRGGRVLCVHGAVSFHGARPWATRWLPGRGARRDVELDRCVLGLRSGRCSHQNRRPVQAERSIYPGKTEISGTYALWETRI